ncbi:MAG TPA: PAS domain S-box protein, partial [Flavisolibacter sp.]|nr:PAS domain S-box protein [Flavisolibacter sp.]
VAEAWISSADNKVLKLCAEYSMNKDFQAVREKIKLRSGDGLPGKAKKDKRPVIKNFTSTQTAFSHRNFISNNNMQSGVAIPLLFMNEVICVLTFYWPTAQIGSDWFQFNENLLAQLASDIQRRKTEEELNRFFMLTSDLLCVAGMNGCLIKINRAISEVLGYNSEDILNRSFIDFIHPDDRSITQNKIDQLAEASQTFRLQNRCLTADGRVIWVEWKFTSLVSEDLIYGVGRDVTEAKRMEKTIQNEKQRFSDMFEEAPVTMCILKGPNLVFDNANDHYYKFSGRKDIIGKSVREVFPEAEGQGIFELMIKVYQSGETYSINERLVQLIVKENGELEDFYLSFMFQPYYNTDGEIDGIFYFGVDVTEQVVARKKIEESHKKYVDLIQNLPVAVYTCDKDGFVQLYNKAAVWLWGWEPKTGAARMCGSWQIFDKEGTPLPTEQTPMAVSMKNGKPLQGEEIIIKRPDGTLSYVVSFPSPVYDTERNLKGGVNVLVEITDRKKSEEALKKLSLIARKTINAVIITTPDEKIEWVNEAFTRITGFEFEEAIGKNPGALLHGEKTDPATVQFMDKKLREQEPYKCELLKYTKSGRTFWVEIESQPLFDTKGRLTHYFDIETDITERKMAYERLVRNENEIRNFARQLNNLLEEERSRIAREIHDEFGQQLTGLKMSLYSLKSQSGIDNRTKEVVAEMMTVVENSIKVMRSISTELRPG